MFQARVPAVCLAFFLVFCDFFVLGLVRRLADLDALPPVSQAAQNAVPRVAGCGGHGRCNTGGRRGRRLCGLGVLLGRPHDLMVADGSPRAVGSLRRLFGLLLNVGNVRVGT